MSETKEEKKSLWEKLSAPDESPAFQVKVPVGTCAKVGAAVVITAVALPVAVAGGKALATKIFG